MNKENITSEVEFGFSDDEYLPITRCLCGAEFEPYEQWISIYESSPWECSECGAEMVWEFKPNVYLITGE